ncbi:MAG TPA: DNA polymerase III subunit beta [Turneriella sp.]|nr:DNA polymerase III subunit beta [Turneriella sp.]
MKFQTNKDTIDKAVRRIDAIIPHRDMGTMLSNLLIAIETDHVAITASDMETTARIVVPATETVVGEFIIPAKQFLEYVSSLLSEDLIVEVEKDEENEEGLSAFRVNLKGTKDTSARYIMPGNSPKSFPTLNHLSNNKLFNVSSAILEEMIRKTQYAISQEDNRYIYNGLSFQGEGTQLTLVGTDGRRLAAITRKLAGPVIFPPEGDIVVHAKAIREIQKLIDVSDEVLIGVEQRDLFVRVGDAQLSSRLLEGKFPDYKRVLPRELGVLLDINRNNLLNALQQIRPVTEPPSNQCRMILENSRMHITGQSTGSGSRGDVTLDVAYTGEQLEFGFNITYLIDILKALNCVKVQLGLNDANKPLVVHDMDDPDFIALVMPMKI